eukprot:TRINITY_DN67704_c4_g1_i1.p1 TRINITY_DN67704_c4_g1~~TRINITY_DN67704_c4_g1_i1.p1  ORF type:complete len:302 (+),score=65.04 TRINITY_DN67704_c4_g1_i1:44-949(+)
MPPDSAFEGLLAKLTSLPATSHSAAAVLLNHVELLPALQKATQVSKILLKEETSPTPMMDVPAGTNPNDFKSQLQFILQRRNRKKKPDELVEYSSTRSDHQRVPHFTATVHLLVDEKKFTGATKETKKGAEQSAAEAAIDWLCGRAPTNKNTQPKHKNQKLPNAVNKQNNPQPNAQHTKRAGKQQQAQQQQQPAKGPTTNQQQQQQQGGGDAMGPKSMLQSQLQQSWPKLKPAELLVYNTAKVTTMANAEGGVGATTPATAYQATVQLIQEDKQFTGVVRTTRREAEAAAAAVAVKFLPQH